MGRTVGAYEAKTHLSSLLDRVARGERITITKRGTPVAVLVPPPSGETLDAKQIVREMLVYRERQGCVLGGLSLRELIEEGRSR